MTTFTMLSMCERKTSYTRYEEISSGKQAGETQYYETSNESFKLDVIFCFPEQ